VVDGELERGCRSHAVPEDVGAVNAEVVEQRGDVTGQGGRRDGALDVRGAAVALQLDADDGVAAGEGRDEGGEVQVDGEHPAVQQHEWGAVAVFLVVQVQAVDVGVAGPSGGEVGGRHRAVSVVSMVSRRILQSLGTLQHANKRS